MTTAATPTPAAVLKALAQRFVDEVLNAHDLDAALVELVAEDFVEQIRYLAKAPAAPASARSSPRCSQPSPTCAGRHTT